MNLLMKTSMKCIWTTSSLVDLNMWWIWINSFQITRTSTFFHLELNFSPFSNLYWVVNCFRSIQYICMFDKIKKGTHCILKVLVSWQYGLWSFSSGGYKMGKIFSLESQARLWVCGRGDVSTPSFGSNPNPVSTRGGQIMHTLYWCPHQVLKVTGAPEVNCGSWFSILS